MTQKNMKKLFPQFFMIAFHRKPQCASIALFKQHLKINSYNFLRSSIEFKAGFTQHKSPRPSKSNYLQSEHKSHFDTWCKVCVSFTFVCFFPALQIGASKERSECLTHFKFINERKVKLSSHKTEIAC
jgi:hypothetical protein